jgi:hypothetical protein
MAAEGYPLARARDSAFGGARLVLLGLWSGAMLAFGGLFVPAAFSNLPTQLAATVLGEGFGALDRAGIAIGALCVALALGEQRRVGLHSPAARLRAWLPFAGAVAHATSLFVVTPRIRELRIAAGGTIGQLGAGDPGIAQFGSLHSASRALFAIAAASALLAVLWDLWERAVQPAPRVSPDAGEP